MVCFFFELNYFSTVVVSATADNRFTQPGNNRNYIDSNEVKNIVLRIIPIIEEVTERKFKSIPKIEYANIVKIEKVLISEYKLFSKKLTSSQNIIAAEK